MTTETKTYNKRFNAQRAAKSAIGKDAVDGVDFTTAKAANGEWTWTKIEKVAPPVAAKPAKARKPRVDEGCAPVQPDFSANTHRNWRKKLAAVIELASARDVAALKAFALPTYSSSPKAIARYRDAVIAYLESAA